MNAGLENNHPSTHYYDSDYPSAWDSLFPENFDSVTEYQGIAHDVERYKEIVRSEGGPVLELCCGTGRVSIPLAREGFVVTGVDISSAMLHGFHQHLQKEEAAVVNRITLIEQDVTSLSLDQKDFQVGILAFNSLLCIPDLSKQMEVLRGVHAHLRSGAILLVDIVNPLQLKLEGDPIPKPFFTRRNRNTGNVYTRFAMVGPLESDQKQRLYGWYDEIGPDGLLKRTPYSLYWRPIFRFEIELMLRSCGFSVQKVEGGHHKQPYTSQAPRMFLTAVKS
jgi:SAM-dependent methyltransferase